MFFPFLLSLISFFCQAGDFSSHSLQGEALFYAEKFEESGHSFSQALECASSKEERELAQFHLALSLTGREKWEEALKELDAGQLNAPSIPSRLYDWFSLRAILYLRVVEQEEKPIRERMELWRRGEKDVRELIVLQERYALLKERGRDSLRLLENHYREWADRLATLWEGQWLSLGDSPERELVQLSSLADQLTQWIENHFSQDPHLDTVLAAFEKALNRISTDLHRWWKRLEEREEKERPLYFPLVSIAQREGMRARDWLRERDFLELLPALYRLSLSLRSAVGELRREDGFLILLQDRIVRAREKSSLEERRESLLQLFVAWDRELFSLLAETAGKQMQREELSEEQKVRWGSWKRAMTPADIEEEDRRGFFLERDLFAYLSREKDEGELLLELNLLCAKKENPFERSLLWRILWDRLDFIVEEDVGPKRERELWIRLRSWIEEEKYRLGETSWQTEEEERNLAEELLRLWKGKSWLEWLYLRLKIQSTLYFQEGWQGDSLPLKKTLASIRELLDREEESLEILSSSFLLQFMREKGTLFSDFLFWGEEKSSIRNSLEEGWFKEIDQTLSLLARTEERGPIPILEDTLFDQREALLIEECVDLSVEKIESDRWHSLFTLFQQMVLQTLLPFQEVAYQNYSIEEERWKEQILPLYQKIVEHIRTLLFQLSEEKETFMNFLKREQEELLVQLEELREALSSSSSQDSPQEKSNSPSTPSTEEESRSEREENRPGLSVDLMELMQLEEEEGALSGEEDGKANLVEGARPW